MAALPNAGVNLQAKNFKDYIRNLDIIEKKQREAFEAEFKGTSKSYAQVTKAARDYERQLKETANAEKAVAREAEKLAQAQVKAANDARKAQVKAAQDIIKARKKEIQETKKLVAAQKAATAAQKVANIAFANSAVAIARQIVEIGKATFELGKLGAAFDAQRTGLQNLAGSFGQSGTAIQKAIARASKGTISDLDAMQVANEALLLDVARTPEEFEKFIKAALTLGRTVGISASESISRFTTALGRESLLRLDDFGAKASEVNEEIKRLAQSELGKLPEELSKAEKSAIFIEASLNITTGFVEKIGEDSASAAESFDRLAVSAQNLKTEVGLALSDLNQQLGITKVIAGEINQITEAIRISRGEGATATLDEQIEATEIKIRNLQERIELIPETPSFLDLVGLRKLRESLDKTDIKRIIVGPLKDLQIQLGILKFDKAAEDAEKFGDVINDIPPVIEDNTKAIKAYTRAIKQAEQLQLSFARAAEDTALKLLRANEDIARKQGRQQTKLLQKQQKELDKLETSRSKQVVNERREAGEQQKRIQQKLFRELQRAQDRFNLSRLQSERQFGLSEKRLRAEGDILALQQLREDRDLERIEEKENFDLGKKEIVQSAKEQQREQAKDLEKRISNLKTNLENQRAELLRGFDQQLMAQNENFAIQAQDRKIALQREEQDRRISQGRQLQDLGISFANQKDITTEGTLKVADEIGKVFGQAGVADQIITGFTTRTESDFRDLFGNLESIISGTQIGSMSGGIGRQRQRFGGIQEFDDGGIVPGPVGSPQLAVVHGGEKISSVGQRMQTESFQMPAPVIPAQVIRVEGSLDVKGEGFGQANEQIVQQTMTEVSETFRIAVRRLTRRN